MRRTPLTHILYVEDDPDIRTLAQIALEAVGGFKLKACGSGQEALGAVAAGYVPDLLLLDVLMPEMDGPATLDQLRRLPATAATPAVFLTARAQAEAADYRSPGTLGVLAKPFDPMRLAQQVRQLWEQDHA